MTEPKNPSQDISLADIWQKLGAHDEKLEQIHEEVKRTNGTVRGHTKWINDKDSEEKAIAKYKANNPQPVSEPKAPEVRPLSPLEKKLIAIIMALITLAGGAIATGKVG